MALIIASKTRPKYSSAKVVPLGILPIFEEDLKQGLPGKPRLSEALLKFSGAAIEADSFEAKPGQVLTLHLPAGEAFGCLMLIGLGKAAELSGEALRSAAGEAARRVPKGIPRNKPALLILDFARQPWKGSGDDAGGDSRAAALIQALGEGWILGGYAYLEHKTEKEKRSTPDLEIEALHLGGAGRGREEALRRAEIIAAAVTEARNLSNAPANEIHPVSLARRAQELARRVGLSCRVLDEPAIRREKMGALLGVAQGSDVPPRFIILQYRPPGKAGSRKPPLVFVGKAITFDSGGLSIKPAKGMEEMKADMSGGAAVLCALYALAQLKPRVPLIGIIPSAENMVSGRAVKPGDVVRSRSGQTIEVINTDAEGRLILADALDYSRQFRPKMVVDLATLTGACVVALGDVVTGLMSNDPDAAASVRKAAAACGERVWELPLHREYYEALKSDTADLKNSGGRNAGAITAGAFLSRFIDGVPWVHLDIAGTAWSEKETGYRNKGATGVGVRLLVELALSSAGDSH